MKAPATGSTAWTKLCANWQAAIDQAGGWTCRRCGSRIPPRNRSAWQLGHPNNITLGPTHIADLAPEHPHCNESAGATTGNRYRTGNLEPAWAL